LIDEATLLVRVRAPPETWTTRLQPLGQPEPARVDYLFRLVTIFSNDCSKFTQSAKWLELHYYSLCWVRATRCLWRYANIKYPTGMAGMRRSEASHLRHTCE